MGLLIITTESIIEADELPNTHYRLDSMRFAVQQYMLDMYYSGMYLM